MKTSHEVMLRFYAAYGAEAQETRRDGGERKPHMEVALVRIPKSSENIDQNVVAEVTKQLQYLFLTDLVELLIISISCLKN